MLPYEIIFSRVRNKCDDIRELSLDENDLIDIYTERLHSVVGNVRIRQMFKNISLNDETQTIDWELNYTIDKNNIDYENDFVVELFTLGMIIEWLKPKVESAVGVANMIGGKEEKVLKNAQKINIDRLNMLEKKLNRMICDHGYMYNSYIEDYQ